jgi:hypothetical protein
MNIPNFSFRKSCCSSFIDLPPAVAGCGELGFASPAAAQTAAAASAIVTIAAVPLSVLFILFPFG